MYHVEQVLVPVDFSSFSRCALQFALQLGTDRRGAASLQMAHAVEHLPKYVRRVLFPYAPLGEDDRQFEAEIAEAAAGKLARFFEIDDELRERFVGEPVVEFGSSKEQIGRWAGRFDADLIAVGAFGEHGVFGGGPGSTSRRLVELSSVPVALIRDYEPVPEVDRIVAAVDLSQQTDRVVEVARGLAIDLDADLEVFHAVDAPVGRQVDWSVRRHLELDEDQLEARLVDEARDRLDELVERQQTGYGYRDEIERRLVGTEIGVGDPADEIGTRVAETDAQMVVLGAGRRTSGAGPGRVASAVMAEVSRHQVVVPSRRQQTPLNPS